jgi:hypothetical protein
LKAPVLEETSLDVKSALAGRVAASPRARNAEWIIPASIFAGGLLLYVATLAPTVMWGDDATLQIAAVEGRLQASAGSHPAWVAAAHVFTRLPLGETAFRVNLTSAIWAALALAAIYGVLRLLAISRPASALAVAAFGVSHTFWAHAVRPEVYAMTLATSAALALCALAWSQDGGDWWLGMTGLAFGLALSTHVIVLLYLPALAWLFVAQRRRVTLRGAAALLAGAVIGLAPLALLLARDAVEQRMAVGEVFRWALFTFTGYDFSGQIFRFSTASLGQDAMQWVLFLGYQFVGLALILAVVGSVIAWKRLPRWQAGFVLLLYVGPALFAFSYDVGDRYVFFLPSYLAVTAWLGLGIEGVLLAPAATGARRPLVVAALAALLVVTPVVVYRATPGVMDQLGVRFRADRRVPGAHGRDFLLWPPKAGYTDARDYAEAALKQAPPGGLLLADPILAAPMQYLQRVEQVRPDVEVRFCCWDIDAALASARQRPVALADFAPGIYPVEQLQEKYEIVRRDPIYLLTLRR